MDLLRVAVLLSFMLSEVRPCSLPQGTPFYTPTERTVLAPIVFKAIVLNQTSHLPFDEYKACVRVKRVFKADVHVPDELCFGRFGPEELCLEHVNKGDSYIFFVDTDLTARYDGFPIATLSATAASTAAVERGYCKIGDGDCQLPRIDESFKSRIFVAEGKNADVPCKAAGTGPLVVTWTRKGQQAAQRETSLLLEEVAFEDRGTYTCTVRNPAGKVQANTFVFIVSLPCGRVIALGENETEKIESPLFPDLYPRSKMCSWRVCPPPGKRLEFSFTEFDLRKFDTLDIDNECDLATNPWRTYCGSASPGKIVSRCTSGCVTLGMSSSVYTNREAKGFQALVTATDKGGDGFDIVKLFCDSDSVLKVKPRELVPLYAEFNAQILVNYKPGLPAVGDNVTIYTSYHGPRNLYGCFTENVEPGKEYYVFANREGLHDERVVRKALYRKRFKRGSAIPRERFVSKFVVMLGSRKNPPNFEEKLDSYKNNPPQCP